VIEILTEPSAEGLLHTVVVDIDGVRIGIGANDEAHALAIRNALDGAVWIAHLSTPEKLA
jgi:hypothetical protein